MTQTATEQDVHVGLCWECGYALNGLPTPRCPECGRAFDPANPATMNMGRHVGGLAGRLLRPPGWPLYTLTAVAVLLSLWAACFPMPSGQIGPILMRVWRGATVSSWVHALCLYANTETRYAYAVLAWMAVAAVWTVRRVARGVTIRRMAPGQRAAPFAYWRRWLIPHFVLVATILFCRTHGPVYVGYWISKPSIEAARVSWTGNPQRAQAVRLRRTVRWVGVYPVEGYAGLWATHGGPGMDMVNMSDYGGGFIYSPGAPPPWFRGKDVRPLGGGWYSFHEAGVYR